MWFHENPCTISVERTSMCTERDGRTLPFIAGIWSLIRLLDVKIIYRIDLFKICDLV